jgi:hypothetical protein
MVRHQMTPCGGASFGPDIAPDPPTLDEAWPSTTALAAWPGYPAFHLGGELSVALEEAADLAGQLR